MPHCLLVILQDKSFFQANEWTVYCRKPKGEGGFMFGMFLFKGLPENLEETFLL